MALGLGGLPSRVSATLTDFTDFGYGGLKASWDIFGGPNFLPVFTYATGTPGNPMINTLSPLTLRATVTTWTPGPPQPQNQQAIGPTGSNFEAPGDRELFYTYFGNVNWDISGTTGGLWPGAVLQVKIIPSGNPFDPNDPTFVNVNTALQNVRLNGVAPTATNYDLTTSVGTWTWEGLNIASGSNYAFTWTTGTHVAIDAVQLQVIPEPGTLGLLALAAGSLLVLRRKRRGVNVE